MTISAREDRLKTKTKSFHTYWIFITLKSYVQVKIQKTNQLCQHVWKAKISYFKSKNISFTVTKLLACFLFKIHFIFKIR